MKTKSVLLSALFFLAGIVSIKAQSPFQNVFFNLDSNQAPSDWNFVVDLANAAIANGRLEAYTVDGSAALEKIGTMPPNVDSLVFEWDGSVNYAYWGQGTAILMKSNGKFFQFRHGFQEFNGNTNFNRVTFAVDNQIGGVAILFDQSVPVIFSGFHHILQITNHKFHFRAINLSTGQEYFNFSSAISDSSFSIADIEKVRFRLNCTTENNIWQDNLKMELFNSVNCANNLSISPVNPSPSAGSNAAMKASTSDSNPSFVWQSDLGLGFQNLSNYGQYSGVNSDSLVVSNLQLRNHQQAFRVISTSANCVDTSAMATISLTDTCLFTQYESVTTDTIRILVTGMNPADYLNTIRIYPNPATQGTQLKIDFGNFSVMNGYQLRIENALGQQVFQTSIDNPGDTVNLSSLGGSSVYFVRILNPLGNTSVLRKILLQ
jgi:hypothetical protein